MNGIRELKLDLDGKTSDGVDEHRKNDHKEDYDDSYPVTHHPNIVPPTEFMALGVFSRADRGVY